MRLSLLQTASPQPVLVAPQNNGEPDARYPRNNRNQPEFASVLLTLDHLLDSSGFHVHQKAVYSTETPREALVSLMTQYYPSVSGQAAPKLNNQTYEVMKALDENPESNIALYFVPVTTRDRKGGMIVQVVLSMVALGELVAAPAFGGGSSLLAMNNLVNAVSDLALQAVQKMGAMPTLMLMKLEDDVPVRQEHVNNAAE